MHSFLIAGLSVGPIKEWQSNSIHWSSFLQWRSSDLFANDKLGRLHLRAALFFFLRIQLHFPWWSWVCNAVYLCKFFPLQFLLINDLNVLTQLLPSSAFGLHFVILVKMHPWQKHRSCFSAWTAHFHHSETLVMEFRKCCSQEIVMTCPMMEKDSVRWCQRKMHSCAPQEGFQDKRRGVNHGTLPWSHHLLFWEWKESKPTPFTFFTGLSH